jgi:D-beta-D-heptose 7-phosphate kinase/D-beta-D-heptose 1-phosphate adenosyltransferase
MTPSRIGVVESFHRVKVCCVGDVMLDHFVHGSVSRISPEAPVPILRIERRQSMLGGAGNAARNLAALRCEVRFFSVTGDDAAGAEVAEALAALPHCTWHVETETGRRTTIKTRYISGGQQIMRADLESDQPVASPALHSLLQAFERAVGECDVVLLSDYAKGVLSGDNVHAFLSIARRAGKPSIVDPKGRDFGRYRGATVIKPNLKELHEAVGLPVDSEAAQQEAARRLLAGLDAEYVLVTCGAEGMLLVARDGAVRRFPSLAREVFDVSGAGDTAAAALAAGIGSGAGMLAAVEIANLAAGIVVGKHGTAVVTPAEIVHEIRRSPV